MMKRFLPIRFRARLGAIFILLVNCGLAGRAQGTNASGSLDFQAFKILTERNIFDPNRSSDSGGRSEPRKAARVESFAFLGTLSYEKGNFAFFDGTGSAYRKALKIGDTIAGYRIGEITADHVKLEADGKQVELSVGLQMKKQDEGEWQLAGRADSLAAAPSATTSDGKTGNSSGGEENDVLKKLMQQREQELK